MDSKGYPQGIGGIKTKMVGNTLQFLTNAGLLIATFDGDNRTLSVPSGSTVSGAGAVTGLPADDSTLEGTTDMHVKDLGVTAAKLAAALSGTSDGLGLMRVARATFNPSATAGMRTVAAHGLGVTIPDKAIVCGGFVQVVTALDSADHTGSVALHVQSANDLVTAAAINGAPYSTIGLKAITPKANTPESTGILLSAARELTATVTTTALTAGKLVLFVYYLQGA